MTPGMANSGPMQASKSTEPMIPSTKLQMARVEFLGCGVLPVAGEVVSFIGFNRVSCWFGNGLPDHDNDQLCLNFNDFPHTPNKPNHLAGPASFPSTGIGKATPKIPPGCRS